jgi:hypothetical protein
MNRRYGPSLLFASFLALILLPDVGWSAPQVKADSTYAKKIEAMLPPQVECVASSQIVISGQSVTLTARVKGVAAGLVYSFSSNGGRLYPNDSTARLDTMGVPAGRTISATCQVTNGLGQKASGTVAVRVVALQAVITGGHAAVADMGAAAAKNGLVGGGGSPQGEAQHHVAHHLKAEAPPGAEDQAAQAQQARGVVEPAPPPVAVAAAPHVPAAGAAEPAPPPPAAGVLDPYVNSEAHVQWMKALKDGKIEYNIPTPMKLHVTSVVTVVIHGFEGTGQNILPDGKNATLKVSPYMQMQLTAANPDEFEIDPQTKAILPVPIDSSATWTWNVKPKQPATNQNLTIEAFTVDSETGENPQELFPSYSATVSVTVLGFWEGLRELFWDNPSAAIKYVLPGGAGFTVAAGLIVWWWKRRHPSEDKPKKDE